MKSNKIYMSTTYGVVLDKTHTMKFRQHKRLLKDLVKFDFTHILSPYQQRCVDETIRVIKLNIAYHKANKRNKGK